MSAKVHLVKAMVFPVVMYGSESGTIKKAEYQRIDAFELWCWRRPWDCKEIQPVHSEGDQPWDFFGRNDAKAQTLVLWPPHAKSWLTGKDWCWEGLGARGEGDDRGCDGWMASLTRWTWVWVNSGSWWWTGRPGVLRFMGSQSQTRLSNWTELNRRDFMSLPFACPPAVVSTTPLRSLSWSVTHIAQIARCPLFLGPAPVEALPETVTLPETETQYDLICHSEMLAEEGRGWKPWAPHFWMSL